MWYLDLIKVFLELIHEAKDGDLTLEEIAGVLSKHYPEHFDDVLDAVKEAGKDGKYSVGEVMKIVYAVVS